MNSNPPDWLPVPEAVIKAARTQRSRAAGLVGRPTVLRGDLRLTTPPDQPGNARLTLTLTVHPHHNCATVALVHPYPDLATAHDAIIPPGLAGTPYPIVVQTDLQGVIWTRQAPALVSLVAHQTLATASRLIRRPQEATGDVQVGLPLRGQHDRRWPFKAAEGRALDRLTTDATRHLISRLGYRS